jgi:hypothetical protein
MTSAPIGTQFEKLGLFYLGRRHDLGTGQTLEDPVLYESRNLVTHAVCMGMTGSGKTGLCLGIIEEAAIDHVPVLAIDPKGDLGNLLLTFPGLTRGEFQPWVDEDEARRAGRSIEDFAAEQAATWSTGLEAWGQDGERIRRLRGSADFSILTPGSRAGSPVSILSSFAAPSPAELDDPEWVAERATGTATSALALAGVDAPPRSREHSLLASLFMHAWRRGVDLDLGALIRGVQTPPFDTIGVVDLESYFPAAERFDLAMRLNGVLAAPGFEAWLEGEPLDPQTLLYSADGRPRVTICSIAHLGDAERMFFVSLLLNQVVGWMRRQTGTASLRAILYMDEILGYFPPVANPPSKPPLLTLLKQGRAVGLGVLLATQNPIDLDYKGLGNTGTWFLGRLQTERDKARVLDGLEGAAGGLDRAETDRVLSALKKRIFLMHNVHDTAPTVFESRWTLSYLRGPLSRDQIRALKGAGRAAAPPAASGPGPAAATLAPGGTAPAPPPRGGERPVVPPGIQEFFLPPGDSATYSPTILGAARVSFTDRKLGVHTTRDVLYLAPVTDNPIPLDWAEAAPIATPIDQLRREPPAAAAFAPLPAAAAQPRKYTAWTRSFASWLAHHQRVELLRHPLLRVISGADESERDFRIRLQLEARVARDAAVDAVRRKYAPKQAALADRLKRAELTMDREQQQASDQKVQTAVSFGATVLDVLLRRKPVSTGSLGRATTAARGVGRSMKETSDVQRAAESVGTVRRAVENLEAQLAADISVVSARFDQEIPLERVVVTPKRGQVEVLFVALAWSPHGATPPR